MKAWKCQDCGESFEDQSGGFGYDEPEKCLECGSTDFLLICFDPRDYDNDYTVLW